jgi:glycosyltransferase involved in cell wall biosynthesis
MERLPRLQVVICEPALDPVLYSDDAGSAQEGTAQGLVLASVDGSSHRLGRQVILHVGQMTSANRDKGQRCLLQALPPIHAQCPEAQLVLAGRGDDYSRLLLEAQSLPQQIRGRVFMPGYVDEALLERLYQACALFAMPSLGEGFGIVYLEAMARAKPCLGANHAATPSVIRDGETGLLVDDARSPTEVAERIIWLLAHPHEARSMGWKGRELVDERYRFAHFSERFWRALS